MLLTSRDLEILNFINEFGFCEILQIEKRFGLKKPRSYQVMKRLIKGNFVLHQRIFHGSHGVFTLTKQGAECTDLPPLRSIPKDNYEHQLAVINTYFKLKEQYPTAQWIGERRIKHEKFMKGVGKTGHLADGMLLLPDASEIAIEVELTMKSKRRIKDILLGYASQFSIKEVWYFCTPNVATKMSELAAGKSYVKVYSLG